MRKYFINEKEVNENEFNEKLDNAIETYTNNHYDDMLDEDFEPLKIYGATYNVSYILKKIDPINYNCLMTDYKNTEYSDAADELERVGYVIINDDMFEIQEEE